LLNNVLNKYSPTKLVESSINKGQIIDTGIYIAEHFNDYFVNVGSDLARSIPPGSTDFSTYLKKSTKTSLSFYLTTSAEVIRIVNDF